MTDTVHCFEKAGLGLAPFRYAGMVHQDIAYGERVLGSIGGCTLTTKPGSTCDYCGTAITNIFRVESADGRSFKVGCECIKKTGDEGLIRRVQADVTKMERERRQARKLAKAAAEKAYCEDVLVRQMGSLLSLPHPHPYRASQGETLADWARWMAETRHWSTLAATLKRALGA